MAPSLKWGGKERLFADTNLNGIVPFSGPLFLVANSFKAFLSRSKVLWSGHWKQAASPNVVLQQMAVFSLCFQVVSVFLGISNGNSRSFCSQTCAKQHGLATCFGNITVHHSMSSEAGAYGKRLHRFHSVVPLHFQA